MNRLRWMSILMGLVILVITCFQVYWLKDNYNRERMALEVRTDALFHETVRQVQDSLLQQKLFIVMKDSSGISPGRKTKIRDLPLKVPRSGHANPARVINLITQTILDDSLAKLGKKKKGVFISVNDRTNLRERDSAGKIILDLDSSRPEDISEVVVVNAGEKNQERTTLVDSSTGRRFRKTEMLSVGKSLNMDSIHSTVSQINTIYFNTNKGDSFKIKIDSLFNDTLPIPVLSTEFTKTLEAEGLDLPFTIQRDTTANPVEEDFIRRPLFAGFAGYKLQLGNTFPYVIKQISWPVLFSFFLVGITVFSFFLLYRSLVNQYRLSQIKNDLISNITHELKTPIATVGVAIEALKNFNAMQDPQRTREYLDISQNELQRLGLLVDKVLNLSMFEKKEIEVKYEVFDLAQIVKEVVASMRLQIEKYNARVEVETSGDTKVEGDRLHLLSVVFNLLDNALKYNKGNAAIQISIKEGPSEIVMKVTDNGIGIPVAYQQKIFEKFFRVPTGDTHNAKGHGLGLSYVGQVIRQHRGTITVDSHEGIGSTFTIHLPRQNA